MDPTFFAQYRGFEFHCSPVRLGQNAYAPRLVIRDAQALVSVAIPLRSPVPPFEDPTSAAHQAFSMGRRWIDRGYEVTDLVERCDGALVHDPRALLSN